MGNACFKKGKHERKKADKSLYKVDFNSNNFKSNLNLFEKDEENIKSNESKACINRNEKYISLDVENEKNKK